MCITNKRFLENVEVMLAGKDKIVTEEKEIERIFNDSDIRGKVFKNGPSKICGRQLLINFTWSILEYLVQILYNSLEELDRPKLQENRNLIRSNL